MPNFEKPHLRLVYDKNDIVGSIEALPVRLNPKERAMAINTLIDLHEKAVEDASSVSHGGFVEPNVTAKKMMDVSVMWDTAICKLLGIPAEEYAEMVENRLG